MYDRSHKHAHHNHEQYRILVHRKSSGDVDDSKIPQETVASDLSRFAPHSSPKSDPIAAKADGCEYQLGTKGHRTPEPSQRWQSYVLHPEDVLRPPCLQGLHLDALRSGSATVPQSLSIFAETGHMVGLFDGSLQLRPPPSPEESALVQKAQG